MINIPISQNQTSITFLYKFIFFVLLFICSSVSYGQGATCEVSEPFCSDASGELVFENVTGVSSTTSIGCLSSTPNPAWYFLRIDQLGRLEFDIIQWVDTNGNNIPDGTERRLDVDFIAWGPFSTSDSNCTDLARACDTNGDGVANENCPNNTAGHDFYLTNADNTNIVDCSYDGASVESFIIPDAQIGEYYLLLVTNFANTSGKIKLEQRNLGNTGAGETDCSIVITPFSDRDVCGNDPIEIDGTTTDAVIYQWAVFNETTMMFDDIPGETNPILTVSVSGTYQLTVEDIDGNSVIEDIVVTFYDEPVIANTPQNFTMCGSSDGMAEFDFSLNDNLILGTQDPGVFLVSYHTSQDDAENNRNAIPNRTNYTSITTEVFARIGRNDLTSCAVITSFQLTANPAPILSDTQFDYTICEVLDATPNETELSFAAMLAGLRDSSDQSTTLLDATEPLSIADFVITYHRSMADAENDVNPVADNSIINNGTVLFVRVENNEASNPTGCFNIDNIATITIEVSQIPGVNTNVPDDIECATSTADQNIRIFDLTENDANISVAANSPDVEVIYYASMADFNASTPIANPNAYTNLSNPQTIIAQVVNPVSGCISNEIVDFDLVVNPIPILADTNFSYAICEDMDATPNEDNVDFSEMLTNLIASNSSLSELLDGGEPIALADFNVSFHLTDVDAMSSMNPITDGAALTDGTILYVRVENPITGCFNTDNIAQITLSINSKPNAIAVTAPYEVCETEVGSSIGIFDLTLYNDEVTGEDPVPASYAFTYRLSADETSDVIAAPETFEGTTGQIIYVWIEDTTSGCVSEIGNFTLQVNPLPVVIYREDGIECTNINGDLAINLGQDLGTGYIYDWTPDNDPDGDGVENPIFEIRNLTETTTFSLTIQDISASTVTSCENTYEVELTPTFPPIGLEVDIQSDAFSGFFMVTGVPDIGLGNDADYEYQLDDGEFQDSPTFTNLRGGEHTMTIRNRYGCGAEITTSFILIDYPRFFTPNGDGFNDVWRIEHIENQENAIIYIFDRSGKLLKQLVPGEAWDGTYNGRNLPASDYWFRVEYTEPRDNTSRVFKANFSLKR
ncbi:T9SS type B sorting domain-containing protein [Aquimarina rhabdastrellae]